MSNIVENPRYSCTLGGAVATARNIKRTIPILHAGPGCGPQVTMGQSSTAGFQGVGYVGGSGLPSTNMYEKEVIFGGESRLKELIESSIEIIDGDLYFVLSGCTSDIIGDDVASIVEEYRQKGYPIVHAETAGFKGNTYLGYELVFEALIKQLVKPSKKDPHTVNLFGIIPYQDINWQGNLEEISRILKRIGLNANNFLTDNQGIESIVKSSEASLNIIINPWIGDEIVKHYAEQFNIPYIRVSGLPIGPTSTNSFLKQISFALGLDHRLVDKVIEEETEYVYRYFERLTEIYAKYRFAIISDSNTALGYTKFLVNDFGQIPKIVIVTDNPKDEYRNEITNQLTNLEFAKPPKVVYSQDQWEIKNEILNIKPSYVLGSSLDKEAASELSVPFQSISFPVTDRLIMNRAYAGYRGAITLVEDLFTPR
jgi:nitrogenase molybdenum-iron protein beta chain